MRLQSRHSEALRAAEETGYARGLRDSKHDFTVCADKDAEIGRLRAEVALLEKNRDTTGTWYDESVQELAAERYKCADLWLLGTELVRHASEAQSMYGVHAEELIADAREKLSSVNLGEYVSQLEEERGRVRRLRTMLERTMYWLGDQIAKKTLNESAADGTQTLSRDIASLLDVLAETAPRDDGGEKG